MVKNDPIGKAIECYVENGTSSPILVESDLMEDDVIPVDYLFRTFESMPELEQLALKSCHGRVLDVGTAAGPHCSWLREKGLEVTAIDTSEGSINYLNTKFPNNKNVQTSILEMNSSDGKYDTILLLMNGIGLAGDLSSLPNLLNHLKGLLTEKGKILCDSTDVKYFYQEEDGGLWVDLNTEYYGNFKFKMNYDDQSTGWFPWLYVDEQTLESNAEDCGLIMNVLFSKDDSYLAELKIKE